jgi:hypothetical protein
VLVIVIPISPNEGVDTADTNVCRWGGVVMEILNYVSDNDELTYIRVPRRVFALDAARRTSTMQKTNQRRVFAWMLNRLF